MNIYDFSPSQLSGYKGSLEAWQLFWTELAKQFEIDLTEYNRKYSEFFIFQHDFFIKDIPKSIKDFNISNGFFQIEKISRLIEYWPKECNFFFSKSQIFLLKDTPDDVKDVFFLDYNPDTITASLKADDSISFESFFDYSEGVNVAEFIVPSAYLVIMRDSIGFAENLLANGQLYWASPQLSTSDNEWEIACFMPQDCVLVRFNCFARAIIFIIEQLLIHHPNYNETRFNRIIEYYEDLMFIKSE